MNGKRSRDADLVRARNECQLGELQRTVITVLLTFLFTTLGGSLLAFGISQNQSDTNASQVEVQQALEAYEKYHSEIVPDLIKAKNIGIAILDHAETNSGRDIRPFVLRKVQEMPDMSRWSDSGTINLYLGRDAGVGLHALAGQYLGMRVMLERNAKAGIHPVSKQDVQEYLIALNVNYSIYLLEIVKCKQSVSRKFMLYGKLDEMSLCEKPSDDLIEKWKSEIWGEGIFEN